MANKGKKTFFVCEISPELHESDDSWEEIEAKNEKQAAEIYVARTYAQSTDYDAEYTVQVKKSLTDTQIKTFIVRQEIEIEYIAEQTDVSNS